MKDWDVVVGMPVERAEDYLVKHNFTGKIQVIRPGEGTTCDYWPARINLNVDGDGVVVSTNFG